MPKQEKQTSTSKGRYAHALEQLRVSRVHPADKQRVIEDYFEALDTPVSLSLYMLFKHKEHDQIVTKEVDASNYLNADAFYLDFCAVSFLRKNEVLKTSFDKKQAALLAFEAGEQQCRETNRRLLNRNSEQQNNCPDEWLLNCTIRKIAAILGSFDIDSILDCARWGPGVTQAVKGCDTSGATKFDVDSDITVDAYALYGDILRLAYPTWGATRGEESFKKGCVILTVPKNAKTDRTIAVEPGLNSWIQSGIGRSIRRRLRFAGFNLDSDLKNHRGAYVGSLDDSLATIDFKAASDTIAKGLVELLLPPVWFASLNAARSKMFTLNKLTRNSEKFSTMGNGFTFELESLIFVALALAVCEQLGVDDSAVSIFGDDLVLPVECVPQYTIMATYFGFTINTEKSFSQGPFRESCGSFYFNGVDVKPIFFKRDLLRVKDVFRLANSIRYLAHRHGCFRGCDARFRRVWNRLVSLVPVELKFFGPVSSGDATLHANLSEAPTARFRKDGWCGFNYTGLPERVVETEKDSLGLLLSRLSKSSWDRELNNGIPLRARTNTSLKRNMFVHLWYDLGPWF